MQTTVTLPDHPAEEASHLEGKAGLSQVVTALRQRQLAALMVEGYRAEAEDSSLDGDWSIVDLELLA